MLAQDEAIAPDHTTEPRWAEDVVTRTQNPSENTLQKDWKSILNQPSSLVVLAIFGAMMTSMRHGLAPLQWIRGLDLPEWENLLDFLFPQSWRLDPELNKYRTTHSPLVHQIEHIPATATTFDTPISTPFQDDLAKDLDDDLDNDLDNEFNDLLGLLMAAVDTEIVRTVGASTATAPNTPDTHNTLPPTTRWLAHAIASAAMFDNHLWEDLQLPNRAALSTLLHEHFGPLARRNTGNMRWKAFFYKQLCEQAGMTCRSPSCGACDDYHLCFGPE